MTPDDAGWWSATVPLASDRHRVEAVVDDDRDVIDPLVGGEKDIPRRSVPITLDRDVHASGRRAEHGFERTQRGADKNGNYW